MKRTLCALSLLVALAAPAADVWHADNGDGTFTNPLLWGDWPDPDVIRVDDTFYMVSTSMHYVPGVPILQSKDLVNWTMAGYALDRYTEHPGYDMRGGTLYVNGAWAATIRHHNGKFYVGFCTPYGRGTESGHFSLCEADDVRGPWRRTIFPEYLYDPGLFIDDDGRAYVVHGQGTLWLTPLAEDLRSVAGPAEKIWQGGFKKDRSLGGGFGMEGSHMYKVNGWYYILCPAGGTGGWQVCLRSRNLRGPYEHRIVMDDDGSYPDTALPQESLLECPKLTVEQIVGLEDQDTGNVRQGLGATARILGDRPKIIGVLTGCADGAGLDIPRIALRPTRQAMLAQPILKVQQQLLKAGPRHVGQVNLSFPQRRGGGGAFRDILPPRARGLKHLVTKSAVLPDEPIKKDDRQIEDTGRLLEREQIAKSTPLRQEGIPFLSGRTRRHGHPKTSSLAQAQSMLAL